MSAEFEAAAEGVESTFSAGPQTRPTPGDMLRTAREERGLSIQQIADELHLDVHVVRAIEANQFVTLGAPVYARGHLRKYATVLNVAPEEIIAQYELLSDVPPVPTVGPTTTTPPPRERISLRVPAMIVAGLLLAGAVFAIVSWGIEHFPAPNDPAATSSGRVEIPVLGTDSPAQQPSAPAEEVQAAAPPAETSEEPAVTAPADADGAPTPTPGDVTVRLKFTESSWVEVYDAENRRLLYEIGQAGQTRTVSGAAPLRVIMGMASAVTMDVNDRPVPVPRRAGNNATRFTVGPDGAVR